MIKLVRKRVLPLALVAMLAACASQQPKQSAELASTAVGAPPPVAAPEIQAAPRPVVQVSPLHDLSNILSKRSIYYDYDKFEIKPEFRPLIEAHARYLRDHQGARITIQGNTDERGSTEYNIALGQRRSESVMNMLKVLSVPERQMEAVSFGKEKPKALGHDETSWAENRRSDIVYTKEQ